MGNLHGVRRSAEIFVCLWRIISVEDSLRLPIEKKREFAKKNTKGRQQLRKADSQEVLQKASEILGVAVDEKTITALKILTGNPSN